MRVNQTFKERILAQNPNYQPLRYTIRLLNDDNSDPVAVFNAVNYERIRLNVPVPPNSIFTRFDKQTMGRLLKYWWRNVV